MKKALIITYYWPPAGGSGVQRWLKFVKYFRNFGVEPVVYTVQNANYPICDETLINDIPEGLEVLRQPIWEPNKIFSLFGKQKTESAGFLNPNPTFFGKIMQYIRANFFIPDARMFWVKPSVNYLQNYLDKNKIDVIITTGPPHSVHLIGLQLKKKLNIPWIVDFRDPWTQIDYFHQLPLTKGSIKKHCKLEKEVVSSANTVIVVGKTMNKNYQRFNKNIVTITNGFDLESNENSVELDSKFTITHIGLMNADRNPSMLWEVLAEICKTNIDFKNDFQLKLIGKIDASVTKKINEFKLSNNVEIVAYVSHNKVLEFQKKSQVLLLIVNNVPSAKSIITGKIFEYLSAKRPILAIAPKNGDLAEILNKSCAGVVINFDEKEHLKRTILKLYNQFKSNLLQVNSKGIEKYHRKALTKKVSEIIYKIAE